MVAEVSGRDFPKIEADRRPGDPATLIASSELAKEELGWTPEYDSLKEIVRMAWEWHRSHTDGYE